MTKEQEKAVEALVAHVREALENMPPVDSEDGLRAAERLLVALAASASVEAHLNLGHAVVRLIQGRIQVAVEMAELRRR